MMSETQDRTIRAGFRIARLRCVAALAICVAAGALGFATIRFGSDQRIFDRTEDIPPAKIGLVLGTGRISGAGQVSPTFLARVSAAAALFRAGKVDSLIASGYRVGRGKVDGDYDEPEDLRTELVSLGVPAGKIIIDDRSYRTRDSVLRIHCFTTDSRIIVISQRLHLKRALFIGWTSGRRDIGFAATDPDGEVNVHEILADALALVDLIRLREPSCSD